MEDLYISDLPFSDKTKMMLRSSEIAMRYLGVVALVEEFKGREDILKEILATGRIVRYYKPDEPYLTASGKRPSVYFTKERSIVVGLSGIFLGRPEWVDIYQ